MNHLGFHFQEPKKGVYVDGHERADVVEYRQNRFIPLIMEYKRRMTMWKDDVPTPPENKEEKEIVWVVHDESTFAANDNRRMICMEDGRPPIRPKGNGHCIMVFQFLCPCHGQMEIEDEKENSVL